MEKYPKVESKIFRGGAVVGESIHFQDKMKRLKNEITFQSNLHCICIYSADWSTEYYFEKIAFEERLFRSEPKDQQHVAGVSRGTISQHLGL